MKPFLFAAARPVLLTLALFPALALLGALLSGDWAVADVTAERERKEASGLVAAFLQWHLERGLRSLPLVDRG